MKLCDVLYDMDFSIDIIPTPAGQGYQIIDNQTHEVLGDRSAETEEENYIFYTVESIIERLTTYIEDYWFREIKEELSELGELSGSWEDMYNKTLKLKNRFKNPEYLSYLDVIDHLVHPIKFEGVC